MKLKILKPDDIEYFKPEKKKLNKNLLYKKMLREAISLLVLNDVFPNYSYARSIIKKNVLNPE